MTAKYKKVILKRRFHVTIPLKKLTTRHQKISMPYGTFRTLSVNFKPWNASDKNLPGAQTMIPLPLSMRMVM